MKLRSDLTSYLDELKEKGAHESDLARLIKSHYIDDKAEQKEAIENQGELERMRQVHSQLVASHQHLKNDHQKLIGMLIHRILNTWKGSLFLRYYQLGRLSVYLSR